MRDFALVDYPAAYDYAVTTACALGIDQAIRRVTWFGRMRYQVSSASRHDSDYARYEIVTPRSPRTQVCA
ncbi:hypothetical protein UFOVP998_53 [uncultured Caudovirales phage]|uniref:Uncharacterized protein n=1 Tax=uncultured Caudovirales phage TaxID=2100421 RepID=A0A6J5SF15_9CAUD|nr:hypothetical protein UFOVP998_53 [uncultured Caudovirales phage]CAB4198933.1 hypothetical protein UFOVP1331_6 [uncultured Caudovirales phage]CAB4212504.1 hypothetical protein UFOVP1442_7 [uncultured Caudovirales phage]CAB5228084.1 hypothetical protein UFOVP1535_44 [uncultured Caudovirales phage]